MLGQIKILFNLIYQFIEYKFIKILPNIIFRFATLSHLFDINGVPKKKKIEYIINLSNIEIIAYICLIDHVKKEKMTLSTKLNLISMSFSQSDSFFKYQLILWGLFFLLKGSVILQQGISFLLKWNKFHLRKTYWGLINFVF